MKRNVAWIVVLACALGVSGTVWADEYEPGLAAHYYKDATNWNGLWPDDTDTPLADPKACTFTDYKYVQIEPLVNHLFIRSGWFSVRWVGYIDVPGDGENVFLLELWADDGCRLQIDETTLINSWYACPENIEAAHRYASATLTPGKHRVVIEYFQGQSLEANDSDPIKFYWSCQKLGIERRIVPEARLCHKAEDEGTPEAWKIKPPQTVEDLCKSLWELGQEAEETGDYTHALRLYRRILLINPDSAIARKAKERVLAIEADPTIEKK
ncbi:MAG: PA14 domain-containing protein [Planctomycetota bacterium]